MKLIALLSLVFPIAVTPLAHAQDRVPVPPPEAWDQADDELRPTSTLRVYDVRDLATYAGTHATGDEDPPEPSLADYESLATLVRENVAPRSDALGPLAIQADAGGFLVVNGTGAHHAWIEQFLADLRGSMQNLYDVQIRIAQVPTESLPSLELPSDGIQLDDAATDVLLQRLQSNPHAEVVTAPRVLTFARQEAHVLTSKPFSYVSEYRYYENVQPGDRSFWQPVVETVAEGIETRTTVTPLGAARRVLEFQVELTEVTAWDVVPTAQGDIVVPEVSRRSASARLTMLDGRTAAFAISLDETTSALILVRASEVRPTEIEGELVDEPFTGERRAR